MPPISDDPFPLPEDGLDRAVRRHLDGAAAEVDAGRMWAAVSARAATANAPPSKWPSPRRLARTAAALAAGVLVAVFLWGSTPAAAADPAAALRAARAEIGRELERCYEVSLERQAGAPERFPGLFEGRAILRTRGSSFASTAPGGMAWGRGPDGRIWLAATRKAAAAFAADELPRPIREAVAVRSLELPVLLDEVLADFDLAWKGDPKRERTIVARRRTPPGMLQIASAEIGLTPENAVERVVLTRRLSGNADATITFALTGCPAGESSGYTAGEHLDPGAEIYDGSRPVARRRALAASFGEKFLHNP